MVLLIYQGGNYGFPMIFSFSYGFSMVFPSPGRPQAVIPPGRQIRALAGKEVAAQTFQAHHQLEDIDAQKNIFLGKFMHMSIHIYIYEYVYIYIFIHLFLYLFIYLSIYLFIYLFS